MAVKGGGEMDAPDTDCSELGTKPRHHVRGQLTASSEMTCTMCSEGVNLIDSLVHCGAIIRTRQNTESVYAITGRKS